MTEQVKSTGMKGGMKGLLIVLGGLIIVCLVIYAITSTGGPSQPKAKTPIPPSQSVLDAMENDLAEWGEGRWHNWDATYHDGMVELRVAADPAANETALNGYCDILRDIAKEHAPGYTFVGNIAVLGEIKKKCY